LALAGEVRLCDELMPLIDRGEVPLLESESGKKTLLLEFPHSHVPTGCEAFMRWLLRRNIVPLLVHPERNKELMVYPNRLQQLRETGCLVQITAAAVTGEFGKNAQRTAIFFLDKDWVNMVASDAHNLRHRPPLMREAADVIATRYGDAVAQRLFESAPTEIAGGSFSVHSNSTEALLSV
jgi:protein-tyrosine phosphatase